MSRVVIVGGGISGLALAYHLRALLPSADVLVLEQQTRAGGVIGTVVRDGFTVEAGPNALFDANPVTIDLARRLGLGEALIPASESAGRNRYLLLDGRLRLVPGSLPAFLGSDLLSWVAKLELLDEPAELAMHVFRHRQDDRNARFKIFRYGEPMLLSL